MRKPLYILTAFLLLSAVIGCNGSVTDSGGSQESNAISFLGESVSEREVEQLEHSREVLSSLAPSAHDENWTAPKALWLDVDASPLLHASLSFDELLDSMSSLVPFPLGTDDMDIFNAQRSFGVVHEEREWSGYKSFSFGNLFFDDYSPGTYKMRMDFVVYNDDVLAGRQRPENYRDDSNVRRAEIVFMRRTGSMKESEQKALYDYLYGKLSDIYVPIPLLGEENREYRNGEYAKFGAFSGSTGLFVLTIGYNESLSAFGSVDIKIETNATFVYTAPDLRYFNSVFDPEALKRIMPDLVTVEGSRRVERYVRSQYGAIRPDRDGRVSAQTVLEHEFGDGAEMAETVRDADGGYIDSTFARMAESGTGFSCWSVGMTPFTVDILSCVSQRQSIEAMTPVVDYTFTALPSLSTVREDLSPFSVTQDFRRLSTLSDTKWHGLFDDKEAAIDVFRQLICGLVDFYEGSGYSYYASGLDLTPLLLLPYYSNALNEETGVIGYRLWISGVNQPSDIHPAFNISGVEMELAENDGRFSITVRFQRNERYAGFIIPDGSAAIPDKTTP